MQEIFAQENVSDVQVSCVSQLVQVSCVCVRSVRECFCSSLGVPSADVVRAVMCVILDTLIDIFILTYFVTTMQGKPATPLAKALANGHRWPPSVHRKPACGLRETFGLRHAVFADGTLGSKGRIVLIANASLS